MHHSKVQGKFQLYKIRYITNENTFQIILHNSGGHFVKNKVFYHDKI